MNNYRKIYFIYDIDEKTGEIIIKNMIGFRNDNGEAVIEDYNEQKHLEELYYLITNAGFNVMNKGLEKAQRKGLFSQISADDKTAMASLQAEILKSQVKSTADTKPVTVQHGQVSESSTVDAKKGKTSQVGVASTQNDALADYFKKLELINEGKISSQELEEVKILAKQNESVARLEALRARKDAGAISQKVYDRLCNYYKKKIMVPANNVGSLNKSIEDQELEEYFRKDELRNAGKLSPEEVREIERLAENNREIAALEYVRNLYIAGRLPEEDFKKFQSIYKLKLQGNPVKIAAKQEQPSPTHRRVQSQSTPKDVTRMAPQTDTPQTNKQETQNREVGRRFASGPVISLPSSLQETGKEQGQAPSIRSGISSQSSPVTLQTDNQETRNREAGKSLASGPVITPPSMEQSRKENDSRKEGEKTPAPGIHLNKEGYPASQVKGAVPEIQDSTLVPVGKEKLHVRVGKWIKKHVAKLLAAITGLTVGGVLFKAFQSKKNSGNTLNPGTGHTQTPSITTTQQLNNAISSYCTTMKVPSTTINFLSQENVREFLKQYKNVDQLNEVLSALCYGYEANILTRVDNNFRLDEDGKNYLYSFTNDFLCAKVVVNNYTPEQMLAVFGNTNITYEQLMDGFKGYCTTVSIYGSTATTTLPFHYLTNGDAKTTEALTGLFEKLAVVNENRKNDTLTSEHTDDFIAAVHEFFVQGAQKLELTEGTKTVAAALVDAYLYGNANIANGEALYLHEDHGAAKAGVSLLNPTETHPDGTLIDESKDSLLNYIYVLYTDEALVNQNCVTTRQILLNNIDKMRSLANSKVSQHMTEFANLLYQNGLDQYANEISKGNYSQKLLNEIEATNPLLAEEIDNFEQAMKMGNTSSGYIPFDVTVNGVDELLGIKGKTNDIAALINIRYEKALDSNYKVMSGQKYAGTYSSSYGGSFSVPAPTVTTTTVKEEVSYEDLTSGEQQEVDQQKEEMHQQEEQENQQQIEQAESVAQNIINLAQEGEITQEEAEELASEVGMELEPGLIDQIQQIHDNPEIGEEVDQEIAENNEEVAREEAEEDRKEQQQQADELSMISDLISKGDSATISPGGEEPAHPETELSPSYDGDVTFPDIDYGDSGHISTDAGEEPVIDETSTVALSSASTITQSADVTSQKEAEEDREEQQQQADVTFPDIDYGDSGHTSTDAGEEPVIDETSTVALSAASTTTQSADVTSQKEELQEIREILTSIEPTAVGLDPVESSYEETAGEAKSLSR